MVLQSVPHRVLAHPFHREPGEEGHRFGRQIRSELLLGAAALLPIQDAPGVRDERRLLRGCAVIAVPEEGRPVAELPEREGALAHSLAATVAGRDPEEGHGAPPLLHAPELQAANEAHLRAALTDQHARREERLGAAPQRGLGVLDLGREVQPHIPVRVPSCHPDLARREFPQNDGGVGGQDDLLRRRVGLRPKVMEKARDAVGLQPVLELVDERYGGNPRSPSLEASGEEAGRTRPEAPQGHVSAVVQGHRAVPDADGVGVERCRHRRRVPHTEGGGHLGHGLRRRHELVGDLGGERPAGLPGRRCQRGPHVGPPRHYPVQDGPLPPSEVDGGRRLQAKGLERRPVRLARLPRAVRAGRRVRVEGPAGVEVVADFESDCDHGFEVADGLGFVKSQVYVEAPQRKPMLQVQDVGRQLADGHVDADGARHVQAVEVPVRQRGRPPSAEHEVEGLQDRGLAGVARPDQGVHAR